MMIARIFPVDAFLTRAMLLLLLLLLLLSAAQAQNTDLGADNSDSIAVIIGNKAYRQTVPVDFAHNDADAMKDFLIRSLGYREANVFILKDATLNEFNQMFGTEKKPESGQLWRAAKEGRSNIFVYYSGHGVPDLSSKQPFLLPADGDPNQGESGYLLETLYRNLDLIKAKIGPDRQVVVMVDACFTGETGRKGETLLAVSAPGFAPAKPTTGTGVIKLLATSAATPANWDNDNQLGLFTSRFLLASAGLAATGESKEIAWADLRRYVIEGVSDAARRDTGRAQVPEIDEAPLILKADGPVPAIEKGYGSARDEANWRKAEEAGTVEALENYVARCGSACTYKQKAMSALAAKRNAGAAAEDDANWKRLSPDGKFQEYLDGCGSVCAFREIAESYVSANDPDKDQRVKRCDALAGAPFDPDRPKETKRVCGAKIDTGAAIKACTEAAAAFPKLRRLSYQLGRAHDYAGAYDEALAAYKIAADQGSAAALNNLATLHEYGQGVKKSMKEAEALYRQAAEAGGVIAMSNLGRFLEYGLAGRKDVAEAAQWYKKCADLGDPFCATKYANMILAKVPGAEGDGLQAILSVRKAADQGEVMAMTTMAVIVDMGFGASAGASKPAVDYLKQALKRGERGATAVAVPDVFGKLAPETRRALQKYLAKEGGYKGPIDGKLNAAFTSALKRHAVEVEKATPEEEFADAGESCG
jgi:TPR repeat protein/uncharacterized caspase-like protein